jgi:hypothetical protein
MRGQEARVLYGQHPLNLHKQAGIPPAADTAS